MCPQEETNVLVNPFVGKFRGEQSGMAVIYVLGDDVHGKSFAALRLQYFINIVIKGTSHVANIRINGDSFNYLAIFAHNLIEISS